MAVSEGLAIGALARRTGLAVSAIRYYEAQGLISPWRNAGGQRRYQSGRYTAAELCHDRAAVRPDLAGNPRVLSGLPGNRTPTPQDWKDISLHLRARLDQRIDTLMRLRDNLDGCIGCGCLSLPKCALYNPDDRAKSHGSGPRYLMGTLQRH